MKRTLISKTRQMLITWKQEERTTNNYAKSPDPVFQQSPAAPLAVWYEL
jgi:hypothetical protein